MLPKYEQMVNPENEAFLQLITTADGSKTIYNGQVGEHYHSIHGALQESRHVFLESGLSYFLEQNNQDAVSILEAGFGTGLNFLLSATYCSQNKISLRYTGIEAFPLPVDLIRQCAYQQFVNEEIWDAFISNYDQSFRQEIFTDPFIQLEIIQQELSGFNSHQLFDILYFDAFAVSKQPEMWTLQSLGHICHFLRPGGIFVTYAMNGNLKRNMQALGFHLEKIPGAAGKREMLRATLKGQLL